MTPDTCSQCNAPISPEDSVYDDREARYYCDMPCFLDWADDNSEKVAEYYVKLNVTGG